jgi:hypothetical protein
MMNAQLERHLQRLESFDSDEEYEESPQLHQAGNVQKNESIDPMDTFLLKSMAKIRPFVPPRSYKDVLTKMLWVVPFAIALGDFIGLLLSFNLAFVGVLLLQMNPNMTNLNQGELHQQYRSYEAENKSRAKQKKTLSDCRKEVSRILGLIGAPPLQWTSATTDTLDLELKESSAKITDGALIAVIKFVEAHSQFLLTIDQAYIFLRTSSSIHLGLGPHSQCVERVERAAIAREYRTKRRRSSSAGTLINQGVNAKLEPQLGANKSVLALVSVRQNLARSIVNQSESLQGILKGLEQFGSLEFSMRFIEALELPDIIDLAWIKSARQLLAESLSICTESLCTIGVLEALSLSDEQDNRLRLEDSMCNTRNAREHLLCTLLLGNIPIATPLAEPNDKLFRTLLNYKIHLDALGVALWSCQQYHKASEDDEEQINARNEWWSQIKQMGETCRAFENQISQNFFHGDDDDSSVYEQESVTNHDVPEESGDYEHGNASSKVSMSATTTNEKTTKTIVFSGKGSVDDRPKKTEKNGTNHNGYSNASALPYRDTVSEVAMVSELQNRIKTLCPPELEDEESESEEEKAAKAARQPAAPLFLGASGSLLSELKQSIPSMVIDPDENAGEELIGGD